MAKHAQITKNNKFVISLQYLKKEVSDEVFFAADKNESFVQIDTMILMGWSIIPKVLKMASLRYFYNVSQKRSYR